MKATATQYAKTLYELTIDKTRQEIDGVVSKFLEELQRNGQIKIADQVVNKFQEIYNAENGIVEAEVVTREKISESLENKVKNFIKEKYFAKHVEIHNKIDENLRGGIIIRVGDEILDGSLDRKLRELRSILEK